MQLAKESSFFQEVLCLENISVVENTKLSIKCIVSPGSIQISKSSECTARCMAVAPVKVPLSTLFCVSLLCAQYASACICI